MRIIDNYIGIEPFTVLVDDSSQLEQMAEKARGLRVLSFKEKLEGVKKLALESMVNAYEQMVVWERKADDLVEYPVIGSDSEVDNSASEKAREEHEKFKGIVFHNHPLSFALEKGAGCFRYQGALFFVLSYEADLGDQHFVQTAPVNNRMNTVFNEVIQDDQHHKISIFADSLKDKSLDYSRQNPKVLEQAFETFPGLNFYSYHRTPSGLVIAENPDQHAKTLVK